MRDRVFIWLELTAWAAAWGLTLLCLELIVHDDVRHSSNVQTLLAVAVGLLMVILSPFVYREFLGVRAQWRVWRGFCRACGYSLVGLERAWARAGVERCPECGSVACGGKHDRR